MYICRSPTHVKSIDERSELIGKLGACTELGELPRRGARCGAGERQPTRRQRARGWTARPGLESVYASRSTAASSFVRELTPRPRRPCRSGRRRRSTRSSAGRKPPASSSGSARSRRTSRAAAAARSSRTTTPFLGPFSYRELDDAARRVQLVDDVSGAARLPCPAYGACVYLTSAYSKMAYLRAGTW